MYLQFTYAGSLQLEKVSINTNYIISVEKPKSDKFGCIITVSGGNKYPVSESYDTVLSMIRR